MGIIDWIDSRTGIRRLIRSALYEHVPGGARWRYVWGSTLTFAISVQFITGAILWMAYSPSAQTAWESVHYINDVMPGGWWLRGIHHFMAQIMVPLLVLHFMQVIVDGAYKAPREFNYWFGLGLLVYVVGRVVGISILEMGSQPLVVAGALLLLRGPAAIRLAWFPILYFIFMIPLPGFLVDAITGPLKQWISAIVVELLYHLGYPISRTGVMITVGKYEMLVADACSGLHSMYSLSALGTLFMYIMARARSSCVSLQRPTRAGVLHQRRDRHRRVSCRCRGERRCWSRRPRS
jgi:hypothetical protein